MKRKIQWSILSVLVLTLTMASNIGAQDNGSDDAEILSPQLSEWMVTPEEVSWLHDYNEDGDPAYLNRGGTYNPATGNVIILSSEVGEQTAVVVDGESGDSLSTLTITDEIVNQGHEVDLISIDATSDGQIFAVNQVLGDIPARIYKWDDEEADPEVVFSGVLEFPEDAGEWAQWGQGFGIREQGENIMAFVSGFQNPGLAVFEFEEEEFAEPEIFDLGDQNQARGSIAEIPGQDSVWVNGADATPKKMNIHDGELGTEISDQYASGIHMGIDYIEMTVDEETHRYALLGPNYPDLTFKVVDVTNPDEMQLLSVVFYPEDEAVANINLDGFGNFTNGGDLIVMSANNPLFRYSSDRVVTSSDLVEQKETVNNYELSQNYPNPFNPVTTIEYAIPEAAEVTLEVYDMLGRQVKVLEQGHKQEGRHSVEIDGSNLSSGTYIYRLSAGTGVMTNSMTLIK